MANLVIRPAEFAREIKVVMEERRLSTEDQPRALLDESLLATAFSAHPYKWPTIGWMQDLQNMTWKDAARRGTRTGTRRTTRPSSSSATSIRSR